MQYCTIEIQNCKLRISNTVFTKSLKNASDYANFRFNALSSFLLWKFMHDEESNMSNRRAIIDFPQREAYKIVHVKMREMRNKNLKEYEKRKKILKE